jgi:Family of unknown function (DUF5703)
MVGPIHPEFMRASGQQDPTPVAGGELAGGEPVARGSTTGAVDTGDGEGNFTDGAWEYRPVHLPGDVSRMTAAVRLAIQAEFGGWELSRVRLYPGGVRKVWLRRRRTSPLMSGPTI